MLPEIGGGAANVAPPNRTGGEATVSPADAVITEAGVVRMSGVVAAAPDVLEVAEEGVRETEDAWEARNSSWGAARRGSSYCFTSKT